jgi:hypothetical protein
MTCVLQKLLALKTGRQVLIPLLSIDRRTCLNSHDDAFPRHTRDVDDADTKQSTVSQQAWSSNRSNYAIHSINVPDSTAWCSDQAIVVERKNAQLVVRKEKTSVFEAQDEEAGQLSEV